MRIAGYAALFLHRDGARDTIVPGAFARTLAERQGPLPLYWPHRSHSRVGWVERIAEDARGLRVIAAIDHSDTGQLRLADIAALFWHCLAEPGKPGREAVGEAVLAGGLAAATAPLRVLLGEILRGSG